MRCCLPPEPGANLYLRRYGDAGQNYKNIAVLLKSLPGMPFTEGTSRGCQRSQRSERAAAASSLWSLANLMV